MGRVLFCLGAGDKGRPKKRPKNDLQLLSRGGQNGVMFPCAAEKYILGRLALVFAAAAAGFFSATAAPNYFTRTWQVEQGLPQNKVTAVVQTRDGYLWTGTYSGLARFDGIRFTVFDDNNTPELRSSRVTSLFEAGDGTLWIGTESGDVSQYKDGHFAAVPVRAKWGGGKIYAITADDAGDVWLLNEAGELARVRDGKVLSPPTGAISKVVSLARGQDGVIWVNREGYVSALKGGQLSAGLSTNDYLQGLCAARDGGMWVASNGGIRKWKDGEWSADLGPAPWQSNMVANFLETSAGALAGGTSGDGLWLAFPGLTNASAMHFVHTNGLPSDWVISLWEDREKNLWCGTGAGLVVIRPSNLETISPPDKWKSCPVLSVLPAPDGALWVGTEGAGLYRLQNGSWTNFDLAQGIRNSYVWSLAADGGGGSGPAHGAEDCSRRRTMRLILGRGWKIFFCRRRHFYLWATNFGSAPRRARCVIKTDNWSGSVKSPASRSATCAPSRGTSPARCGSARRAAAWCAG